jgi:hypothetical protein
VLLGAPSPTSLAPPPMRTSLEPPRPSDTGGHRAFSSTWNGQRSAARPWSTLRAALPALAVAAGAVGAVWVVAARRAPAEPVAAATPLEDTEGEATLEAPPRRPPVRRHAAVDAGVEAASAPRRVPELPAFFAGRTPRATPQAESTPPLAADELPQVDDARDSLQAAIVRSAKAQRRALRLRRAKPPSAVSAPATAPSDVDTTASDARKEPR